MVAVVYSQPIESAELLKKSTFDDIEKFFSRSGKYLQLIAALSDTRAAMFQPANALIKVALQIAFLQGFKEAVGVTRWSGYPKWREQHPGKSAMDYYEADVDPTVWWHKERGAKILSAVPDFRPSDTENDGMGVLFAYNLAEVESSVTAATDAKHTSLEEQAQDQEHSLSATQCLAVLKDVISDIVCIPVDEVKENQPLFEMGLGSLDVFEMRQEIGKKFGVSVPPASLFFRFPTLIALAEHYGCDDSEDMQLVLSTVLEHTKSKNPIKRTGSLTELGISGKNLKQLTRKISANFGVDLKTSELTSDSTVNDLLRVVRRASSSDLRNSPSGNLGSARSMSDHHDTALSEIVQCRFLGYSLEVGGCSAEELWRNSIARVDMVRRAPPERKELKAYPSEGAFLSFESVWCFDHAFWSLSPRESRDMDPQQRLLLKHTYWALENSLLVPEAVPKETGVFVGLWSTDFREIRLGHNPGYSSIHTATGVSPSVAAGRLSYWLGTEGPAFCVDTACSSGLVALDCARNNLLQNRCDMAVVGAVNVILSLAMFSNLQAASMLSKDARCKTFDASANGYVRSEACGVLCISTEKESACASSGVLVNSFLNQDGKSGGLTVPSQAAQQELISRCMSLARVKASDIGSFEAHGTGTHLGDPIEVHALSDAHGERTTPLILGSIKASVGHCEASSGIVGLVKMLKDFCHQRTGSQIHFSMLNQNIGEVPLSLVSAVIPLEEIDSSNSYFSAISNFGFSGTNAHVIIRKINPNKSAQNKVADMMRSEPVIIISAESQNALESLCQKYAQTLTHMQDCSAMCVSSWKLQRYKYFKVCGGRGVKDLVAQTTMPFEENGRAKSTKMLKLGCVVPDSGWSCPSSLRTEISRSLVMPTLVLEQTAGMKSVADGKITNIGSLLLAIGAKRLLEEWNVVPALWSGWGFGKEIVEFLEKKTPFTEIVVSAGVQSQRVPTKLKRALGIEYCDAVIEVGRTSVGRKGHKGPWLHMLTKQGRVEMLRLLVALKRVPELRLELESQIVPLVFEQEFAGDIMMQAMAKSSMGSNKRIAHKPVTVHGLLRNERDEKIKAEVEAVLCEVAGCEKFDMQIPFTDFGFDSNMTVEAVQLLRETLNVELFDTLLFDYPCGSAVVSFLCEQLSDKTESEGGFELQQNIPAESFSSQRVYILGLASRCAGKATPSGLWQALVEGTDCITVVPSSRWDWRRYFSPAGEQGKTLSKWGCFHEDFSFDAKFFGISAREAKTMDVQQQWMLEVGVEAVEDADIDFDPSSSRSIGVYTGICKKEQTITSTDHFAVTGGHEAVASGRVSYFFGFTGACMSINTACSSSLVAVDLGVRAARMGREEGSLCFGVIALFDAEMQILLSQARMLSPTGHCKTFDISADGYVRGEGCAAAFIGTHNNGKYVEVLSSAVNQDGRSNGITSPNGPSQTKLVQQAMAKAARLHESVAQDTVFVETHGTGTALGDPMELQALANVKGVQSQRVLHSVKTNIGHAETAAGIFGVVSSVLSAVNSTVPKILHFSTLNVSIGESLLQGSKFTLPLENICMIDMPRFSFGVSSFGFSGTNVHVVMMKEKQVGHDHVLIEGKELVLRAKTSDALERIARASRLWIIENGYVHGCVPKRTVYQQEQTVMSVAGKSVKEVANGIQQQDSMAMVFEEPPTLLYQFERAVRKAKTASQNADSNVITDDRTPLFALSSGQPEKVDGRANEIKRTALLGIVKDILGVSESEKLDANANLAELGFDSTLSIELAAQLTNLTGDTVQPTVAYDYPQLNLLLKHFETSGNEHSESQSTSAVFQTLENGERQHIFVSGHACRIADSWNPDQFFKALLNGEDMVGVIPENRWSWKDYYWPGGSSSLPEGKTASKWGSFLADIFVFDHTFFKISSREASNMDPQQRLLLETSWEAFEDSGLDPLSLGGSSCGVYGGIEQGDFWGVSDSVEHYVSTGYSDAVAAGRISYFLGLVGAAVSINTACSSSLVAMSLAYRSLETREETSALCFGVKAIFSPKMYVVLSQATMLSPTGRCKGFDQKADGYVRGEACVSCLLENEDRKAKGQFLGYSINQDGASNGLTAPNGPSQVELIRRAIARCNIDGGELDFIEAHGTGTSLGDPIEVASISKTYGKCRQHSTAALLRSVKSNIGHAEHGAGLTGVLSGILAACHNKVPRHLHLQSLNPFIGTQTLEQSKIVIPLETTKFYKPDGMVFAVSSFGFSGTNCHVLIRANSGVDVMGEIFASQSMKPFNDSICINAKTSSSLQSLCAEYAKWLMYLPNPMTLQEACRTRSELVKQATVSGGSCKELVQNLLAQTGVQDTDGVGEFVQAVPTYQFAREFLAWSVPSKGGVSGEKIGKKFLQNKGDPAYQVDRQTIQGWYCTADHVVYDVEVVPGAAHISVVMEQCHELYGWHSMVFHNIEIMEPVFLYEGDTKMVLQYRHNQGSSVEVKSYDESDWHTHLVIGAAEELTDRSVSGGSCDTSGLERVPQKAWDDLKGIHYGKSFRWIRSVRRSKGSASYKLVAPDRWNGVVLNLFPAETLDSLFQTCMFTQETVLTRFMAPFAADKLRFLSKYQPDKEAFGDSTAVVQNDMLTKLNIRLFQGTACSMAVDGFTLVYTSSDAFLRNKSEAKASALKTLFYQTSWKPLNLDKQKSTQEEGAGIVVVVGSDAEVVRRAGGVVKDGNVAKKMSEIVLQNESDVVSKETLECDELVNVFPLDHGNERTALHVWVAVCQQILKSQWTVQTCINVIQYAHTVKDERVRPWSRAFWSLGRTFTLECSGDGSKHILVDLDDIKNIANVIRDTKEAKHGQEIAVRGSAYYEAKLSRVVFEEQEEETEQSKTSWYDSSMIRLCAVSGGSGGLGILFSKLLLGQNSNNSVIVLSRSGARSLVSKEQVTVSCKSDCGNAENVGAALMNGRTSVGRKVTDVLHLAGILRDELLRNSSWINFKAVVSPKVSGARALHMAVREKDAKFVLFSSATSLLGNVGQANYGVANGFLDGLASYKKKKYISVEWGPWAVGMFAATEGVSLPTLKKEEALDLMNLASESGQHELGCIRMDWNSSEAEAFASAYAGDFVKPKTVSALVSVDDVEEVTMSIVSRILNVEEGEFDETAPLFELGVDSSMSIELRNALEKEIGVRLSPTLLFDYPTMAELVKKIKQMVASTSTSSQSAEDKIDAEGKKMRVFIEGAGCRFGACLTLPELWDSFLKGIDGVGVVDSQRFAWEDMFDANPAAGRSTSKWGAMVNHYDEFDAAFFSITPREACAMDPKNRVLLETVWECCETAGRNPMNLEDSSKPAGVYLGVWPPEYLDNFVHDDRSVQFLAVGTSPAAACGRVSYFYGLSGTCIAVDTACSASLVALNFGCDAVARGSEGVALCGGTNSICSANLYIIMSKAGMLSPDGRCKTFDASANGYVRGEGCGMLLVGSELKGDAGMTNLAEVAGVGVNQDGKSQGLTAPNGPSQSRLIQSTLAKAGLDKSDLQMIEAHGTGTSLGDPIEVQGLTEAVGGCKTRQILLGSSKTNYGHAETAAGVLGIFRVLLGLKTDMVGRHLHFASLNPYIGPDMLVELGAVIALETCHWPASSTKRKYAGISSFGFSGTNSHVIVGQTASSSKSCGENNVLHGIFVVSAKTEDGLKRLESETITCFMRGTKISLDQFACRANFGQQSLIVSGRVLCQRRPVRKGKTKVVLFSSLCWRAAHLREVVRKYWSEGRELTDTRRWLNKDSRTNLQGAFYTGLHVGVTLMHYGVKFSEFYGLAAIQKVLTGELSEAEGLAMGDKIIEPRGDLSGICIVSGRQEMHGAGYRRSPSLWLISATGSARNRNSFSLSREAWGMIVLSGISGAPAMTAQNNLEFPGYPFTRKSFWAAGGPMPPIGSLRGRSDAGSSGRRLHPAHLKQHVNPRGLLLFSGQLSDILMPELKDMLGLVHIGIWTEVVLFCVQEAKLPLRETQLELHFVNPLFVKSKQTLVHLALERVMENEDKFEFEINCSQDENASAWKSCVRGHLSNRIPVSQEMMAALPSDYKEWKGMDKEEFYKRIQDSGVTMGQSVAWVRQVYANEQEKMIVGEFEPFNAIQSSHFVLPYPLGFMDAIAQLFFAEIEGKLIMTKTISNFVQLSDWNVSGDNVNLRAMLKTAAGKTKEEMSGDVAVFLESGAMLLSFHCDIVLFEGYEASDDTEAKVDINQLSAEEALHFTIKVIREKVAELALLEASEIEPDAPLTEIGLDSMMTLSLTTYLSAKYDWDVQILGTEPVSTIAQVIRKTYHKESGSESVPLSAFEKTMERWKWVSERTKSTAKCSLYCFPYGGGGASIFREWNKHSGDELEVFPVQYPGHEERMKESCVHDVEQMAEEFCKVLLEHCKGTEVMFYGHSMGGLVAYCVYKAMSEKWNKRAILVGLGGISAPSIENYILQQFYQASNRTEVPLLEEVGEKQYLEWMEQMDSILPPQQDRERYISTFGKVLNADLRCSESFFKKAIGKEETIDCAIYEWCASEDPYVSVESMAAWKRHTSKEFREYIVDSKSHLFVNDKGITDILPKFAEFAKSATTPK